MEHGEVCRKRLTSRRVPAPPVQKLDSGRPGPPEAAFRKSTKANRQLCPPPAWVLNELFDMFVRGTQSKPEANVYSDFLEAAQHRK